MIDDRIFENIETKEDIIKMIELNSKWVLNPYLQRSSLEMVIPKLVTLSKEDEKKAVEYIHHVDNFLNIASQAEGNKMHKIPTFIIGMHYMLNHPDKIEGLDLDEITLLSKYSIVEDEDFYNDKKQVFTKDILKSVLNKTKDDSRRDLLMNMIMRMNKNGSSLEEIQKYIEETPIEELVKIGNEQEHEEGKKIADESGGLWI